MHIVCAMLQSALCN